jgi:hypothetical protein
MKNMPTLKSIKQKIGTLIYYGAVPVMILVGIRSAMNAQKEMEEMAGMMSGPAQ